MVLRADGVRVSRMSISVLDFDDVEHRNQIPGRCERLQGWSKLCAKSPNRRQNQSAKAGVAHFKVASSLLHDTEKDFSGSRTKEEVEAK